MILDIDKEKEYKLNQQDFLVYDDFLTSEESGELTEFILKNKTSFEKIIWTIDYDMSKQQYPNSEAESYFYEFTEGSIYELLKNKLKENSQEIENLFKCRINWKENPVITIYAIKKGIYFPSHRDSISSNGEDLDIFLTALFSFKNNDPSLDKIKLWDYYTDKEGKVVKSTFPSSGCSLDSENNRVVISNISLPHQASPFKICKTNKFEDFSFVIQVKMSLFE